MKKKTKSPKKKAISTSHKLRGVNKKSSSDKHNIMPLGDRILLKPISAEELNTTASGIIIPDTVSKEKPEQGRVVAVGEGRWEGGKRVPVSVNVGDKVVFSRYGYDEVKYEGEEFYILKEENILAVIKS